MVRILETMFIVHLMHLLDHHLIIHRLLLNHLNLFVVLSFIRSLTAADDDVDID